VKTDLKLVLSLLAVLATACGGAVERNAVPREAEAPARTCSIKLAPDTSADAIQRMVQQVTEGLVDPCAGALPRRDLYSAQLASTDETPDGFIELRFWMRLLHPWNSPTERP